MAETNTPTIVPETVSKNEFDKVVAQAAEKDRSLETLKSQLLDPEYISYLESKNQAKTKTTSLIPQTVNLASLSLDQLRQLIREEGQEVINKSIAPIAGRLTEVQATLEANAVRAKYSDFNDYADKIVGILENSNVTIEQAYLMARAGRTLEQETAAAKTPKAEDKPQPKGSEKPGTTVPLEGDTIGKFKNETEAGMAAWSAIQKKHGLSGDTI